MLLCRSSVEVKTWRPGDVFCALPILKVSLGGLRLQWDGDVLLTGTQPDNLFCLDGFIMFTDVLSL